MPVTLSRTLVGVLRRYSICPRPILRAYRGVPRKYFCGDLSPPDAGQVATSFLTVPRSHEKKTRSSTKQQKQLRCTCYRRPPFVDPRFLAEPILVVSTTPLPSLGRTHLCYAPLDDGTPLDGHGLNCQMHWSQCPPPAAWAIPGGGAVDRILFCG